MNYKVLMLFFTIAISVSCTQQNEWEILSPDENVKLRVVLESSESETKGSLSYEVFAKTNGEYLTIVNPSPLGLMLVDDNLMSGLNFVKKSSVNLIDETYEMISGKKRSIHNVANELTLTYSNINSVKLQLVLRSANDGVAFRYVIQGEGDEVYTVTKESTGFSIPTDAKTWMPPYDKPAPWSPGYETYYTNGTPIADAPDTVGWSFPAMFNTNNHWLLISEAGPYTEYVASHLEQKVENGTYKIRFPEVGERNNEGVNTPSSTLPWAMPWRFIIVGKELNNIVESNMVYNLAEPNRIDNSDWIKPGRASWSWWSSTYNGRNYDTLVSFVDLAAEMKWEYTLVDAFWETTEGGTIDELIEYSNSKNVGVILWYNSGGRIEGAFKKDVYIMSTPELRKKEMKRIHDLGVKGIKVDFFNSDKQHVMKIYQGILEDAAEYEILVNFHGCTLPRGWTRTYPNLLTQEAVRGGESYRYDELFPEASPWHNTIAFFVRGTVGSMDYGPVMLSNQKFAHKSTFTHEIATSLLLETGIIHFADKVEVFNKLDDNMKEFLSEIPAAWEDIKLIAGYPGEMVVVARKSLDGKWYIIGTNGENKNKSVNFEFSFLDIDKEYSMLKITDKHENTFAYENVNVTNSDNVTMSMLPYGGFILVIE